MSDDKSASAPMWKPASKSHTRKVDKKTLTVRPAKCDFCGLTLTTNQKVGGEPVCVISFRNKNHHLVCAYAKVWSPEGKQQD